MSSIVQETHHVDTGTRPRGLALAAAALALLLAPAPRSRRPTSRPTPVAPAAWSGLHVKGRKIGRRSAPNSISKGFGIGEWTNTEAYLIEWPTAQEIPLVLRLHAHPRHARHADGHDGRRAVLDDLEREHGHRGDFARMHGWGVNTLRISINYHWLSPSDASTSTAAGPGFDQMVAWGKAHGIYLVLCMHAAPGAQSPELMADSVDGKAHLWTEPSVYQPWATHLWTAIAQRYANETTVAGYDLLDEPLLSETNPASGGSTIRAFYVKLTRRSARSTRTTSSSPAAPTGAARPPHEAMLPTWDDNMALVFHKYWDKNNTASIRGFLDIRSKNNVPLWNGETGESDAKWASGMVDLMAANGIGWSWWTYKKVNQDNQPCSIPEPPNYDKILAYVGGTGSQPSPVGLAGPSCCSSPRTPRRPIACGTTPSRRPCSG